MTPKLLLQTGGSLVLDLSHACSESDWKETKEPAFGAIASNSEGLLERNSWSFKKDVRALLVSWTRACHRARWGNARLGDWASVINKEKWRGVERVWINSELTADELVRRVFREIQCHERIQAAYDRIVQDIPQAEREPLHTSLGVVELIPGVSFNYETMVVTDQRASPAKTGTFNQFMLLGSKYNQ